MTARTAPAGHGYKQPECVVGLCEMCPGPCEVRLPGRRPAWEMPIETLRCACTCHTP